LLACLYPVQVAFQGITPGRDPFALVQLRVEFLDSCVVIHQAPEFVDGDLPPEPQFLADQLDHG
jgi:hypothetical protein